VETVAEMLHPGVTYRHLILTVPEALRTLLYQHAVPLLEGLMQATLGRDPLVCPRCGATLWLWRLWHPRYGILYDAWERLKQRGGCDPHERSPGPAPG